MGRRNLSKRINKVTKRRSKVSKRRSKVSKRINKVTKCRNKVSKRRNNHINNKKIIGGGAISACYYNNPNMGGRAEGADEVNRAWEARQLKANRRRTSYQLAEKQAAAAAGRRFSADDKRRAALKADAATDDVAALNAAMSQLEAELLKAQESLATLAGAPAELIRYVPPTGTTNSSTVSEYEAAQEAQRSTEELLAALKADAAEAASNTAVNPGMGRRTICNGYLYPDGWYYYKGGVWDRWENIKPMQGGIGPLISGEAGHDWSSPAEKRGYVCPRCVSTYKADMISRY